MNDDLIEAVTEAIYYAMGGGGGTSDPELIAMAQSIAADYARVAVATHTEWLLAQGGVTDEVIHGAVYWRNVEGDAVAGIRAVIARAIAQATAEAEAKIARVEALREKYDNGGDPPSIDRDDAWRFMRDLDAALSEEDA